LEEIPGGPAIGQRHPIVHVQHIEEFEQDWEGEPEVGVKEVTKHQVRSLKKGKKIVYRVLWEDGDESWRELKDLVDQDKDGTVINEALLRYWEKRPWLRQRSGL
jgi:hypothetical protein